jgi:hypothetical protein
VSSHRIAVASLAAPLGCVVVSRRGKKKEKSMPCFHERRKRLSRLLPASAAQSSTAY